MDSAADRAAAGAAAGQPGPSGASNKRPAQQPPPHITQASRRTKKNGRGRRTNQHSRSNGADANAAAANAAGAAGAGANNSDDLVRVVPVPPDSVLLQEVRQRTGRRGRERSEMSD